jgi:GNAT superfamily N-acetyltransferase
MEMLTIENPDEKDTKPIEEGVMQYGLLQVDGEKPRKWAFHMKDNGKIIGGATGRDLFSQFYLDNIWVKEEYRSMGIGEEIHKEVVACAIKCDCNKILLSTLNRRASKFYKKLGYETLAVIEEYVIGFNLIYMEKKINNIIAADKPRSAMLVARKSRAVEFKDIVDAFDFVSFGQMYTNQAFLNKETGKIYWYSEYGDNEEELPEDIDDEIYIEIPHKNELELGKRLVLEFTFEHLPEKVDEVEEIFRNKGAYSKFKALLERKGVVEKWYEYESQAKEKSLRMWCKENKIKIHG